MRLQQLRLGIGQGSVMVMQQCLSVSLPLHFFRLRGQPLSPGCLSNLSSKHGSTPAPIRELYINLCTASQPCWQILCVLASVCSLLCILRLILFTDLGLFLTVLVCFISWPLACSLTIPICLLPWTFGLSPGYPCYSRLLLPFYPPVVYLEHELGDPGGCNLEPDCSKVHPHHQGP